MTDDTPRFPFPGAAHQHWLEPPDEEGHARPPSVAYETGPRAGTDYCAACDASGPAGIPCLRCRRPLSRGLEPSRPAAYVLYWHLTCYRCQGVCTVRQGAGELRPALHCRVCGHTDVAIRRANDTDVRAERRRAANSKEW